MKLWGRLYGRYLGSDDTQKIERRVELVTIGLAVLLLLQLLVSGLRLAALSEPDAMPPSLDSAADAQLVGVEKVSPAQRDEISARPLFWVTRRPLAGGRAGGGNNETTAAKRGSLKNVELLGVFGSGAAAGVIVLVEEKERRVLLDQKLEGWTLRSVQRESAEFARGDRREKLALAIKRVEAVSPKTRARERERRGDRDRQPARNKVRDAGNSAAPVDKTKRAGASTTGLGWGVAADEND